MTLHLRHVLVLRNCWAEREVACEAQTRIQAVSVAVATMAAPDPVVVARAAEAVEAEAVEVEAAGVEAVAKRLGARGVMALPTVIFRT